MSKKQKKEQIIKSAQSQVLSLRDGCSISASRLALLSSMLLARSRIVPPLGFSKQSFDDEFDSFLMEQIDCLRDYLFALGSGRED